MSSSHIIPPSTIGDYTFSQCLGRGGFSAVYHAIHNPTKMSVAIKIIPKALFPPEKFARELELMRALDHPFCIAFYEFLQDEDHYYLVMENIEGGNLLQRLNGLGSIPENQMRHIYCQLICALDYLHTEIHVAHRDVKLENIMFDKHGNIRLIDFGLGNVFNGSDGVLQTACGSPAYAPPEMFRGEAYNSGADIWSSGIVLYSACVGRLPFEDPNIQKLVTKIVYDEVVYPDTLSPELVDLLRGILNKDQKKRVTIPMITQHPWFTAYFAAPRMNYEFGIEEQLRQHFGAPFVTNEELIRFLTSMGIDINSVMQSLTTNQFNSYAAPYRILFREYVTEILHDIFKDEGKSSGWKPLPRKRPMNNRNAQPNSPSFKCAQRKRLSPINCPQPMSLRNSTNNPVQKTVAMIVVARRNPVSAKPRARSLSFNANNPLAMQQDMNLE